MTRWHHSACPKCSSSDAFSFKDDDVSGYCFSCNRSSPVDPDAPRVQSTQTDYNMHTLNEIESYDTRGFKERGITKATAQHLGMKVSYSEDGTIHSHFYPYTKDGTVVAYKERTLPKSFVIHGDFKGVQMFGQAQAGNSGKRIIITEGELDCAAVSQAQFDHYQLYYAVVALPSATATSMILENREWLRGFGEVIIAFDMDEPGKKAAEVAAKIIGYDKAKVCAFPEKDPCDVLIKHGPKALMRCIWDAKSFSPSGVIRGEAIWEQFKARKEKVSVPYPDCLSGLNEKLQGMRMGEIVLFTSGTGSGKSTVIKEIVFDILEKTQDMIGMVSLEESIGDTANKFINMQLKVANIETPTEEQQYEAFKSVFGDERLVLLDHQGSVSDESLIDKMEYLALMGCKYIILDHITIAVSEGTKDKTGNEAVDSFMNDLLKLAMKHNIWLGVISHLRKGKNDQKSFEEGKMPDVDAIKGSGSIKQVSFDIIAFCRNMVAEDARERNTIKFRVLKSRFTGNTGDCGSVLYNVNTGRLEKQSMADFE